MPLRAYLAGLVVLFVIAAGGAVVYGRIQAGDDARTAAQEDARFAARLAAEEIGGGLTVLQQTVAGAAANPGIAKAFESPEDCGLSFGGTDAYTTGHIDLVRSDGTLACSSMKEPKRGYEGASWLARAQREPLLSAPETDPRTGKQVVLAAAPVPKLGVVVAMFNLDGVGKSLGRNYGGPRGLEFEVADRGTTLARSASLPENAITATATVPDYGWRVTAAADRAEALAASKRLNRRELTIILAGLALFLLAAAVVHRRVARPLAQLDAEVRRATAAGAPRPVTVGGPQEVRSLAGHMNQLGASLVREQAAYRVLFEGSPLPMWVHDTATRRILEANEAAVAAYGYSHEELLNTTVDDLEREPNHHARKDGSTMEVSVASHPIAFRGHDACIVIAEDVTEKERLRHQLQQSQRIESLGQLAGGVAHDFNNLLAVILGYASFIERRAEPGSADERDVTAIREAGERASRLTRQLLSFARREVVRPTVLDLTGVVLEMEQLLRRTIGEHVVLRDVAGAGPVADHGRRRPARAGAGQPRRQRPRRDARGRHAHARHRERRRRRRVRADPHRARPRPLRAAAGERHRRRDDARRRRAGVRAVLHHQAQGPGHGARPGDDLRHRHPGRRPRADLLRAGPGHHVHRPAAGHRRRRAGTAGRATTTARPAAARRSWSSRTSRRCSR